MKWENICKIYSQPQSEEVQKLNQLSWLLQLTDKTKFIKWGMRREGHAYWKLNLQF